MIAPSLWTSLLNHLWQSSAFVLAAALLSLCCLRQSARVRFWIWWAASIKFLLPFSLFTAMGAGVAGALAWRRSAPPLPAKALLAASAPFHAPLLNGAVYTSAPTGVLWLPTLFIGLWLGVTLLLLARWSWRWTTLARLVRAGTPLASPLLAPLTAPAVTTSQAVEPGVFGIFRPVLLLPADLLQHLSPAEFTAFLAHERCHMRRRDNLWAASHTLVECLFWFNPLVWWTGSKLVAERERACDEDVLLRGGDPATYASGILAVCRLYAKSTPTLGAPCAAGVTGGELKRRMAAIMEAGRGNGFHSRMGALTRLGLGLVAACVLLLPLAAGAAFNPASPRPVKVSVSLALPHSGTDASFHIQGDALRFANMPVNDLIQFAYGLHPFQVQAPDSVASVRVNLDANGPLGTTAAPGMVRSVLLNQLRLRGHFVLRQEKILALTPIPGRPQSPSLLIRSPARTQFFYITPDSISGSSLGHLADLLTRLLRTPVLDETGLPDPYRFQLRLKEQSSTAIQSALNRQMGMQLVPRNRTVRVYVLDRILLPPAPR